MKKAILKFWSDESGATAIEYGLIAGLISVAIVAGATILGDELKAMFCKVAAALKGSAVTCTS